MNDEARVVLESLHKRNFEAYYIGGKCRNELHNQFHDNKVEVKDIDIVTNATVEEIKAIFPNIDVRGESFQVAVVNFAGYEFEVATYRKDVYNSVASTKVVKPETVIANSLNDDRERRDFTINAIAQDINGNFIDYNYVYRNKKISAIQDIKLKQIRAIGNAKQRFEEDPLRILRAFRFMAQLGYEIEKQTFKAIESNLKLIERIPHERISGEMNKLIIGQFAYETLTLMKSIGFFNLKVQNANKGGTVQILPGINKLTDENLKIVKIITDPKRRQDLIPLEVWTVLFCPLGIEESKVNLESISILNGTDIRKVEWLIENFNIIHETDMRNAIFNARTGIVKDQKLMCMRELLKTIVKIHSRLNPETKEKGDKLIFAFRSRPYFDEQLKIDGNVMMEIAGEKPGPWLAVAKNRLLYKLVNSEKFPKEIEKYMELVNEAVEEAIFEKTIKEEGLL